MTPEQAESRFERVAIMMFDGKLSEEDAEKYCDCSPDQYGIRDFSEKQGGLFA